MLVTFFHCDSVLNYIVSAEAVHFYCSLHSYHFLEVLLNCLLHSVTVFFISILLNIIVSVVVVEDVQFFYLAHSLHIVTLV